MHHAEGEIGRSIGIEFARIEMRIEMRLQFWPSVLQTFGPFAVENIGQLFRMLHARDELSR